MKTSVLKVNIESEKPIQSGKVKFDGSVIYRLYGSSTIFDGSELLIKTQDKIEDNNHISFLNLRNLESVHLPYGTLLKNIGKIDKIEVTIEKP